MMVDCAISNTFACIQAMGQLTSALEQNGLIVHSERIRVMSSIASSEMHSLALLAGVMTVYTVMDAGAQTRECEAAASIKLYVRELDKARGYHGSTTSTCL